MGHITVLKRNTRALGALLCFGTSALAGDIEIPRKLLPPEPFESQSKRHQISPSEVLARFEEAPASEYVLGQGDKLLLEVWGRPELGGEHVIGPDGKITLPVAGPVQTTGLTREQAREAIQALLERYYFDLAVTLTVDDYASNHIYVLGRVAEPGLIRFDSQPTLLEAITRAGGLPIGGVGADKAALTKCAVFRGRDQLVWIDLKRLLQQGDLSLNIRLRRDDVLYIPDAEDQLVYVLGEVEKPGALRLTPDMTLLDALTLAGGPTRDAAKGEIELFRPDAEARMRAPLDLLLRPGSRLNVSIEEGDVLYLPKRGVAKVGYVFEKLSPLSSMLIFGSALTR